MNLLDINNTMFTIWDYPMSYIEFFGTIFNIWCVWLTARAKVLSWPVGLAGTILYLFLFYQIQLYSDLFEQVFFLITGLWGWWMWLHPRTVAETDHKQQLKISFNTLKENGVYLVILALGTALLTYITKNLNIWLPQYFPEPAAFPFLDAFTTSMSFLAQWLLMKKRIESWMLWIVVDAIGIGLYWAKGVKFVSIEYLLFFFIATFGLIGWIKMYKGVNSHHDKTS